MVSLDVIDMVAIIGSMGKEPSMGVGTRQPRALLVEDDARSSIRSQLQHAGYEVSAVEGKDAFWKTDSNTFDVLFAALRVPDDGLSLLREMTQRKLDLPTIIVLPKTDNALAVEAAALGAVQALVKPLEETVLKRAWELIRQATKPDQIVASFHSRIRGHLVPPTVSATDAKNEFGTVLETAIQKGAVVITKHESPRAVLLAIEEFSDLIGSSARRLDTLSSEFDALLDRMQAPGARERMKRAFDATPRELGRAAVKAASRKNRRG
jgi:prevent-host-death family protein